MKTLKTRNKQHNNLSLLRNTKTRLASLVHWKTKFGLGEIGKIVRLDSMQRIVYSVHWLFPWQKFEASDWCVLIPDVGVRMLKCTKADRETCPANTIELLDMFDSLAKSIAMNESGERQGTVTTQLCKYCGELEDSTGTVDSLRQCSLCLTASHAGCGHTFRCIV